MKDYIYQFYNESLATTFYLKPINYLKKKIKNKKLFNLVNIFIKIIYTILVLIFAYYIFLDKFPL